MEKIIKTREELEKVISECDKEYTQKINSLVEERCKKISKLKDKYVNFLIEGKMQPKIFWAGKLHCGRVKYEILRVYFYNQPEEIKKKKDGTESIKKGKIEYMKFLDLFTILHSGIETAKLNNKERLNFPVFTTMKKFSPTKPLVWSSTCDENKVDHFVNKGQDISMGVLKDICFILSTQKNPLFIRNAVKELLESNGISCKIDKLEEKIPLDIEE